MNGIRCKCYHEGFAAAIEEIKEIDQVKIINETTMFFRHMIKDLEIKKINRVMRYAFSRYNEKLAALTKGDEKK